MLGAYTGEPTALSIATPDFFAATPRVVVRPPTGPVPVTRPPLEEGPGNLEFRKGPEPVFTPARESKTAHPDSPVGRTARRLARGGSLATLAERIGRPLLDLATVTDHELHQLTALLLAEKHRRTAHWFDLPA